MYYSVSHFFGIGHNILSIRFFVVVVVDIALNHIDCSRINEFNTIKQIFYTTSDNTKYQEYT